MEDLEDLGLDDILGDEPEEVQEVVVEEAVIATEGEMEETVEGFIDIIDAFEARPTEDRLADVTTKFDTLADAFGTSNEDMKENIEAGIQEIRKDAVEYKAAGYEITEEIKASAFNIDLLSNDFAKMRSILLDSLADGRAVQKKFTDEMLMVSIDDISPTVLEGFSSLMKAVANQVQLLSKIYKDVAETQVKLKQYMRQEQMDTEGGAGNDGTSQGIGVQNNYIVTTNDLINGFLPSKS